VQAALEAEVGRWAGWSRADRQLVVNFLMANLTPNIYLNLNETQLRRSAAAAAVDQVFTQIRAGQVIVRRGDEIDRDAMDLVRELSGEAGTLTRLRSPLASAILLGLSAGFLWVAFRRKRLVSVEARAFGGVVVLLILGLVAARFGLVVSDALAASFTIEALSSAQSYALAIPFAGVALLASLLYGRGAGLLAGLVFSVFVGRLGWGEAAGAAGALTGGAMFYSLTGSLAAVFALDQLKERSAVTRAGVLVGVVNMASVTLLALIEENGTTFSGLGIELFCGLLGGLMVAAVVAFAMPVFEAGLFRTTDIKLMELSDTNLPLLQRLAFEAPGTFQHSLMVAHFAKACCEAVGGNPTLAYVGGLYHDIGKMTRPRYFVENQHEGENPHDGLSPSMSALIIIDHVKEGARMAREHGLPQPIIDAVAQASQGANYYCDHRATELRAALAREHSLNDDQVTVGAGSVALLYQLAVAFVDPDDEVVTPWISFEAYPIATQTMGGTLVKVPLTADHAFDLDGVAEAVTERTKLVLLATPNNPTGTAVSTDQLGVLLRRITDDVVVLVDEAYREFADPALGDPVRELLPRFGNVAVARTFSKAFGLAGLRVGYVLAHPEIITAIDKCLMPFNVNGLAQAAALAALGARSLAQANIDAIRAERARVSNELAAAGWRIPASQANFVWLPLAERATPVCIALEQLGVVARPFDDVGVRVTIGTPAQNDRFLAALSEVATPN